jgi:aminopeptidase YwaD
MYKKSKFIVFLLVFVMIMSSVVFAAPGNRGNSANAPGQTGAAFDQRIVNNVDVDRTLEHIKYLSKDIGTRPGGMENEGLAANYIADYFEGLGMEFEIQEFAVGDQFIGNITVHGAEDFYGEGEWGFNEWHGDLWEVGAARNGYFTGDDEMISGEVYDVGTGEEEEWTEDVEGKIALVQRGLPFATYVERAENAGAKGVMIYSVLGGRGNYGSAFSPNVAADMPVLGLAYAQGMWLKEMVQEGTVEIDIQTWHYEDLTSQNVVGTKPAKVEDAPIVVIGAHYDSVIGAPGANDNASGTAVTMELARVLDKFNTDGYEIRFGLWGSEERGLLGARHYVDSLTEEELERHIANYNVDMVATSEYERAPYLFVQTVDGEPNVVTETSMAAAERLGFDVVKPSQFGSSDHVPFHNAGIPAAMFIWLGGEGTVQDYTIERYYHTPQDTLEENVCIERLELSLELVGSAVFDLVRKPVPALTNSSVRNR